MTKSERHKIRANQSGTVDSMSIRPEISHVGMLHARSIHGCFRTVATAGLAGRATGRSVVLNRVVLPVIWYVLSTGVRWHDVLPSMGCSGRTAHRRLRRWQDFGIWDALHEKLLALLNREGKLDLEVAVIDSTLVPAAGGGDDTGPNPTDRGKSGSKHTLLVDGNGVPLALRTTGANASDQQQLETIINLFPSVKGKRGRPWNVLRWPSPTGVRQ